ncbi:MAG: heterodisulfide reductase-related iron-sulfur binding cluster, partial [Chloroflexota bacterium]|nr:heterodisulfide reductase-related iron-sulfur binding cluster [Chloroflexota bacterium]
MGDLFWQSQLIYIDNIYKPVILGTLIFFVVLAAVFAFGLFRHYQLLSMGGKENRFDQIFTRLKTTFGVMFTHMRIINEPYPGIMHLLIFWGSALFLIGKVIRPFSYAVDISNPPQAVFLYSSLISEIGAVMLIVGGLIAIYRRYIAKPSRLDTKPDDTLIFGWVFIILLTGFMAKGYRIAAGGVDPVDWATWAPVGYLFSKMLPTFDTQAYNEVLIWHRAVLHTIPAFVFLAYIMISRSHLQHILLTPLNVFFRSLKPKGALVPVDLEEAETFGVDKISGFTWKQLMDLDGCTRCGRCQDNCPAYLSGKVLSPKVMIQDIKQHWYDTGPDVFGMFQNKLKGRVRDTGQSMIGDVITQEMIWDCTTCGACQEACPAYIEHINKVIDMRRNLVLEQAEMPETAEMALLCIEQRGHTCKGTSYCRTDWCADIEGTTLMSEDSDVEILYFVGCSAALEDRNMKVSSAFGKILKAAGVKFGILGEEESCCGDPARRIGNEYLFQMQAMKNIETFKKYGVKKIVVTCPHGYNCLKNEYPQFEGEFEIIHHSQYIAELIKQNRLKLKNDLGEKITYHDACYLGRHNDVYNEPRQVITSLSGIQFNEMDRRRNKSFCCGAGGGHMWIEENVGVRISEMRTEQALETGSNVIATACQFCLQMFEDAIKAKEASEKLRSLDIAELVAMAIA